MPSSISAILIENQKNLKQLVKFSLESTFNFNVISCSSSEQAINLIENDNSVQAVVLGGSDSSEKNYSVFELITEKDSPCAFVVANGQSTEDFPEKNGKSITALLQRDEMIAPLNKLFEKVFTIDESEDTQEYTGVSFDTLNYLDQLDEDLYIKLKTGRFLQIFSRGDVILDSDVKKYKDKGVDQLYINKKTHKWILDTIDHSMPVLVKDENATVDVSRDDEIQESRKVEEDPNGDNDGFDFDEEKQEEETRADLVTPFEFEKDFVEKIHGRTKGLRKSIMKNKTIAKQFRKLQTDRSAEKFIQSRISVVCNIACCVANLLHWDSDLAIDKIIYCAHIHDLTLLKSPHLAKLRTLEEFEAIKDTLSEEEQEAFLTHPTKVAEFIRKDKKAPQDADIIIEQHHELPDSKGFPNKLATARIQPFSALLTISIDLAQYIIDNPNWEVENFVDAARSKYRGANHNKILQAITALGHGQTKM